MSELVYLADTGLLSPALKPHQPSKTGSLSPPCADALEDVVRDALGSLSNKLGAQVSLPDLPLPRLMHQAGAAGKAAGGRAADG